MKTLKQFTEEKDKEFNGFMLNEYGHWKVGRGEARTFMKDLIQSTAHFVKEAIVPEKKETIGYSNSQEAISNGCMDINFNDARQQMLDKFNELLK